MIHKKLLLALVAIMALNVGAVTLKKDYSSVRVTGKYLDAVDMSLQFDKYSADFDVQGTRVNKITLRLDKSSINTGNTERDKYISSEIIKIPTMKITLSNITSKQARAKVFINGVLKTVMFSIKNVKTVTDPQNSKKKLLAIQASALLRRKDFGLEDSSVTDSLSSSVKLEFNLVGEI